MGCWSYGPCCRRSWQDRALRRHGGLTAWWPMRKMTQNGALTDSARWITTTEPSLASKIAWKWGAWPIKSWTHHLHISRIINLAPQRNHVLHTSSSKASSSSTEATRAPRPHSSPKSWVAIKMLQTKSKEPSSKKQRKWTTCQSTQSSKFWRMILAQMKKTEATWITSRGSNKTIKIYTTTSSKPINATRP